MRAADLIIVPSAYMGRVVAGTANDPNARDRGRRARPLADAAWGLIEKSFAA